MKAPNPTDTPFLRPVPAPGHGAPTMPARLKTHWTADELMAMEFVPPVWAVPGIICEGVSLLCGPPKVGKSWASLGLGLAVASGSQALGAITVDGGPASPAVGGRIRAVLSPRQSASAASPAAPTQPPAQLRPSTMFDGTRK